MADATFRLLDMVLDDRETTQRFDVVDHDGERRRYGPAGGEPGFTIRLTQRWSLRGMLLPPNDRRLGEAYMRGDFEVDGSFESAIAVADKIGERLPRGLGLVRLLRGIRALPRPPKLTVRRADLSGRLHSPDRDKAAIAFHYDVGNEFFECFLGSQLVYSCAVFAHEQEDLDTAQERKLDRICRKLMLNPGVKLLDIGCGWGGLAIHAASRYGAEVLGVTLSEEQAALAQQRVAAHGLGDRVRIELRDYREVTGRFDRVASVGMFEHVGPERLAEYFRHVYALTAPGGLFLNHGITRTGAVRARSMQRKTFVGAYVFPDGGLSDVATAVRGVEQAGFEIRDVEALREHYALTLRAWVRNLERNRDRAIAAAGEAAYRTWRLYMSGSAHNFASHSLGVFQVLGTKGARVPLGRAWMEPEGVGAASATSPAAAPGAARRDVTSPA